MKLTRYIYWVICLLLGHTCLSQTTIKGIVHSGGLPIAFASVLVPGHAPGMVTDTLGRFILARTDSLPCTIRVLAPGYFEYTTVVTGQQLINIDLKRNFREMEEVVVTGTMKEISRLESPIPVEVITSRFFQKNPTPNLFEAVGLVNGVKPQLNCNVCNTGDIHINGMEGPYTMILIDGMPIISSLSTVYGLSGIPNSIVDRIEVVKGPASSLYGSEAMGGIINVITKNPQRAPLISADIMMTSWQEYNLDLAVKGDMSKAQTLLGISYFNYQKPFDKNQDGFTDVTLQSRISVF